MLTTALFSDFDVTLDETITSFRESFDLRFLEDRLRFAKGVEIYLSEQNPILASQMEDFSWTPRIVRHVLDNLTYRLKVRVLSFLYPPVNS